MMLEILLWTISGFLIVTFITALSALCMPMRISVIFDTQARPTFFFKLAFFGGLLPVFSTKGKRQERPIEERTPAHPRKPRTLVRWNVIAVVLREIPRLISKIVSRVRLEWVEVNVRFGLADPADTGVVYGALIPVLQFTGVSERSNIVLHPDFDNQVFDGRGHMGIRFVPIMLITPMLSFAWAALVLPRLSGLFR